MVKVKIAESITLENCPQVLIRDLQALLWITNDDYVKKIRLNKWLGNTPKKLNLYITNQNQLIVPYGVKDYVLKRLNELDIPFIIDNVKVRKKVDFKAKENLNLFDYQKEATKELLKYDNGILISPAGSGKTRMAMEIIGKIGVKTLWLTHTLDLLTQSKRVFKQFYSNKVGEISGGKINIQDITFATVQTLSNVDFEKFKDEFDLILTDEVHRVGGTPNNLTMFYKVLSNLNAKYKYGITATIYPKQNDSSITPLILIGDIKHEVLQENVPRVTATHIPIMLDTPVSDIYLAPDKTINYNDLLAYLTYDMERNNVILNKLLETKDKNNIVLTNRNDQLTILSEMLEHNNIPHKVLIGEMKAKDREITLKEFSEGKFKMLLSNYQLAKEGLDLPIADTLHLVMPMRDKRTIIQSKGRVERIYNGKTEAVVYDYVDKNIYMLYNMFKERRRYF